MLCRVANLDAEFAAKMSMTRRQSGPRTQVGDSKHLAVRAKAGELVGCSSDSGRSPWYSTIR
jgi:hypothetical protein